MIQHQAIDKICDHVKQQSQADDGERLPEKDKDHIKAHGPIGVQRMKIDAAAVGLKDWIRPQVIQVHEHRRDEDQVRSFPILLKKEPRNEKRRAEMQEVVKEGLQFKASERK